MAAIMAGHIVAGDVVIVRYEGPKGGPGMREMLSPHQCHQWPWSLSGGGAAH